ncbi:hypothetical protein NUU61_007913 [Penicillium alfredii]|uniref:Uncharacterized protein n=1 Tax=Penicillium alfredii TaxID=1506179 RepID=A0A9W9ERM9_9EURO|nr:uncharacterized protein NUU61_007913 [Penicillium alfredii]KAJ5086606.1 hypothetical protein NUU61_007913 [Penicillium alfredii]
MYIKNLALLGALAAYATSSPVVEPTRSADPRSVYPSPSSSGPVRHPAPVPSDQVKNLKATIRPDDKKSGCIVDFDMPAIDCHGTSGYLLAFGDSSPNPPKPDVCWVDYDPSLPRSIAASGKLLFTNKAGEAVLFHFKNENTTDYAIYDKGVEGTPSLDLGDWDN